MFIFSSPHLVHVRERIRINGVPITKELFSQQFFKVYDKIHLSVSEYFLSFCSIISVNGIRRTNASILQVSYINGLLHIY